MTLVSPSLLAADFLNLQRDIEMINTSQADWLHLDVMDGQFVPNFSFGFSVLQAVARISKKPMDVHLMIVEPDRYLEKIAALGTYMVTVHQEASVHLHRTIGRIRELGMKVGVALNPGTPISVLEDVIQDIDMVLIMSVNPGFGGQKFIEHTLDKVSRMRQMITRTGSHALIQVDGGVIGTNARPLVEAGVDVLVSGSYIFQASDPHAVIQTFKAIER